MNAFSNVPGGIVDTTGTASFNPFNPAVSTRRLCRRPGRRRGIALAHRQQGPAAKTRPLGWLVASVDDANGAAQADEVSAPQTLK